MRKCKYLEKNVDAAPGARGAVFPRGFPVSSHLTEQKAAIFTCLQSPLVQLALFTIPGNAGSQGCSPGQWQTLKAADSCTLIPFVFLHALGLACTWLRRRTCLGLCSCAASPSLAITSPKREALLRGAVDSYSSPGNA